VTAYLEVRVVEIDSAGHIAKAGDVDDAGALGGEELGHEEVG